MTEQKRKQLYIKKLSTDLAPDIKTLFQGQRFKNEERTGDDKAAVGQGWRDYWQIFTQESFPISCPFCLPMTEEEVDGCHVRIRGILLESWSANKYIIPGHHECNMKFGDEFDARSVVKAVEAIEK